MPGELAVEFVHSIIAPKSKESSRIEDMRYRSIVLVNLATYCIAIYGCVAYVESHSSTCYL